MNSPGKKANAETPTEDERTRSQVYNLVDLEQEEEIRVHEELRIRESLMYEQLEWAGAAAAKATAAAASYKRGLPGGIYAAPFPYQGAPHLPPWMTGASRTAYTATSPTSAQPSATASF
jgi:cytochrome c1